MSASLCARAAPAWQAARPHHVLQQTGGRPLCFSGKLLAVSDDEAAPAWVRLRLALYEGVGFYVSEMRGEPHPGGRAWCRATSHSNLAAAVRDFELARPIPEWPVSDPAGFGALDGLALALAWRAREQAQMQAWRRAVGQFLHRLCAARTVAGSDDCAHV